MLFLPAECSNLDECQHIIPAKIISCQWEYLCFERVTARLCVVELKARGSDVPHEPHASGKIPEASRLACAYAEDQVAWLTEAPRLELRLRVPVHKAYC